MSNTPGLLTRSALQLGHVGFQLSYLRLQRAQIGGEGGAFEPHQYPRHDLRRQLGAQLPRLAPQRLYFAGERIQPAVNTVQAAPLLGHLAGERIQPAVNTVQAPAHVAQADPYLSHLAA